eukprot:Sdes_comp14958_c0_seq4m3685
MLTMQGFNRPLSVRVCSWNVKETICSEDITQWIQGREKIDDSVDIYSIGLQEAGHNISNSFSFPVQHLVNSYAETFHQFFCCSAGFEYQELISCQLGGLYSVVYVKKDILPYICGVSSTTYATAQHKGATAIRFQFSTSTICFLNCHLTAHAENHFQRDSDFLDILFHCTFQNVPHTLSKLVDGEIGIMKHDVIFWSGDLNYRIEKSAESVIQILQETPSKAKSTETNSFLLSDEQQILLQFDQLKRSQSDARAFSLFSEMPIHFKPTFKYLVGSLDEFTPKRTPSWTDRVLWYSNPGGFLSCQPL